MKKKRDGTGPILFTLSSKNKNTTEYCRISIFLLCYSRHFQGIIHTFPRNVDLPKTGKVIRGNEGYALGGRQEKVPSSIFSPVRTAARPKVVEILDPFPVRSGPTHLRSAPTISPNPLGSSKERNNTKHQRQSSCQKNGGETTMATTAAPSPP